MKKAKIGIIVDSLNSSKQIFDFIKASKNSKNYEVSHLIVQCNTKNNLSLIEKSKNYLKKKGIKKFLSAVGFKLVIKLE